MKDSVVVPFDISDYLPKNIKDISKSLRIPIDKGYIDEIKSISAYANSNVLNAFPPESIRAIRRSAQSLSTSYVPSMNSSSSLRQSLNNFSKLLTYDIHQTISPQMFDDTLTAMRYYTSTNEHICLQWKNLINFELSDNLISSFMNLTDTTKLSSSLGISEDKLRFMEKVINSANEIDNYHEPTEPTSDIPEKDSADSYLQNNRQKTNEIKNKKYQNISPTLLVWLFIFFVPSLVYIDGSIRNNELEQKISTGIEMTVGAVKSASEMLNKKN